MSDGFCALVSPQSTFPSDLQFSHVLFLLGTFARVAAKVDNVNIWFADLSSQSMCSFIMLAVRACRSRLVSQSERKSIC